MCVNSGAPQGSTLGLLLFNISCSTLTQDKRQLQLSHFTELLVLALVAITNQLLPMVTSRMTLHLL